MRVETMSKLNEWAEHCQQDGIEVCRLEHESDITGLYMTKKKIGDGVPCYKYTSPVYHIWINDKCLFTCLDYKTAYEIYENEKEVY